MRIYIAGPMTGLSEWNYPAFHAAAGAWRALGWDVLNPAESFDGDTTRPYCEYVEADIALLTQCDAIAMLAGWDGATKSGAVWEREIARSLLGLPVYAADKPIVPNPDANPGAGELLVNYDEWRAFQRWRASREAAPDADARITPRQMPPSIGAFVDACIPLTRGGPHGALGRWTPPEAVENSYGKR